MSPRGRRASALHGAGPLAGRRILVTGARPGASALADALRARGAEVALVFAIEVAPLLSTSEIDAALGRPFAFDWIAFTSASAVRAVDAHLRRLHLALPPSVRIASVGPATSQAVIDALPAARVALQPETDFRGAGLAEAFRSIDLEGRTVLLPVSDRSPAALAPALRRQGAVVEVVVAYRTIAPAEAVDALRDALARGLDLATYVSPSAVDNALAIGGAALAAVPAAVIGPTTREAALAGGLTVAAMAGAATTASLADAVQAHFTLRPGRR